MTREEELQQLISEQKKDDVYEIRLERSVALSLDHQTAEGMPLADSVGITPEGEIVTFFQHRRGTVLGTGICGTVNGYNHHGCRCPACSKAGNAAGRERWKQIKSDPVALAENNRKARARRNTPEARERERLYRAEQRRNNPELRARENAARARLYRQKRAEQSQ